MTDLRRQRFKPRYGTAIYISTFLFIVLLCNGVSCAAKRPTHDQLVKAMSSSFASADGDHDHYLNFSEVREALHSLGVDVHDPYAKSAVREHDADGDGVISYDEFVHMAHKEISLLGKTLRMLGASGIAVVISIILFVSVAHFGFVASLYLSTTRRFVLAWESAAGPSASSPSGRTSPNDGARSPHKRVIGWPQSLLGVGGFVLLPVVIAVSSLWSLSKTLGRIILCMDGHGLGGTWFGKIIIAVVMLIVLLTLGNVALKRVGLPMAQRMRRARPGSTKLGTGHHAA